MVVWGVAEFFVDELEFVPSHEAAEQALSDVLGDEPGWEGMSRCCRCG